MKKANIFISYAHKDEALWLELKKHLTMLQRNGLINAWSDRAILPGQEWDRAIDTALKQADIILLLISADFLASEYCYDVEVNQALEQHKKKSSVVVPIVLRHCDWKDAPFGKLQALPVDAKPISEFPDQDSAFYNIVLGLKRILPRLNSKPSLRKTLKVELVNDDVKEVATDVLILKHAQSFHGLDLTLANFAVALSLVKSKDALKVGIGEAKLISTNKKIAPSKLMFLGVNELWNFRYVEISEFTYDALQSVGLECPEALSIAFTLHGVGYGLDEQEVFHSQLLGVKKAVENGAVNGSLKKVYIVERDERRYNRLKGYLDVYAEALGYTKESNDRWLYTATPRGKTKATNKTSKTQDRIGERPFIYATLPKGGDFDDVFFFGIQGAVHANGLLCERFESEQEAPIINRHALDKIERAAFVIADISVRSPSVYMEVGFALAKKKPIVLITRELTSTESSTEELKFIVYDRIIDLNKALEKELRSFVKQ